MREPTLISIEVTPLHFASLIEPARVPVGTGREPPGQKRYLISLPADRFPECRSKYREGLGDVVMATSNREPFRVIGEGTRKEQDQWDELYRKAIQYGYPPNYLLRNRTVSINVYQFTGTSRLREARELLVINAFRVHGPFDKDPALEEHIAEVRASVGLR